MSVGPPVFASLAEAPAPRAPLARDFSSQSRFDGDNVRAVERRGSGAGAIRKPLHFGCTFFLVASAVLGCHRGPGRVDPPAIDADDAAQAALAAYDKNGDARLDERELPSCPALWTSRTKYDANGDGSVDADEIAARIRLWSSDRVAVTSYFCRVAWNGQPLADAEVAFEPEPFLGDAVKRASGRTKSSGYANLEIAPSDLPPDLPVSGVHLGLYKVRITHPQIKIPEQYNEKTQLGHEVTLNRDSAGPAEFHLTKGQAK